MKFQVLLGVGLLFFGLALLIGGRLIGLLLLIIGFVLLLLLQLLPNSTALSGTILNPQDDPIASNTVWHSSTHEGCSDQNRSDTDSNSGGDSDSGGCAGD